MTDEQNNTASMLHRRPARSGNVDISDPVILHRSSRAQQTLIPYFIKHNTSPDRLAIKIETHENTPTGLVPVETKTVSLGEDATVRLYRELAHHLQISELEGDQRYVVLRLTGESTNIEGLPAEQIAQAVMGVLKNPQIASQVAGLDLQSELLRVFQQALKVSDVRNSVAQLRTILDTHPDEEKPYQDWCESHSWAFGNAYFPADDIRRISAGDSVDLLMSTNLTGFRDVVELKKPSCEVLRFDQSHNSWYFSSDTSRAIGQCQRYLDVLSDQARNGLLDHPEVVAYHPRATIVIGRSVGWSDEQLKALHGLNQRLHGITVMTYDHLLSQGDRLVESITVDEQE